MNVERKSQERGALAPAGRPLSPPRQPRSIDRQELRWVQEEFDVTEQEARWMIAVRHGWAEEPNAGPASVPATEKPMAEPL